MPPVQAVILDWAGTTVDYGSRAPTRVFMEIFRRRGIEITQAFANIETADHIGLWTMLLHLVTVFQ